jgi:hypothetical protein
MAPKIGRGPRDLQVGCRGAAGGPTARDQHTCLSRVRAKGCSATASEAEGHPPDKRPYRLAVSIIVTKASGTLERHLGHAPRRP